MPSPSKNEPPVGYSTGQVHDTYANGDEYRGDVAVAPSGAVRKHGHGTYRFANGSCYDGAWRNGRMHGVGIFTDPESGDCFEGHWAKGQRVVGVYAFGNGDTYQGAFLQNQKHGRGVAWESGVLYEVFYEKDELKRKVPFQTSDRFEHQPDAPPHRHAARIRQASVPQSARSQLQRRPVEGKSHPRDRSSTRSATAPKAAAAATTAEAANPVVKRRPASPRGTPPAGRVAPSPQRRFSPSPRLRHAPVELRVLAHPAASGPLLDPKQTPDGDIVASSRAVGEDQAQDAMKVLRRPRRCTQDPSFATARGLSSNDGRGLQFVPTNYLQSEFRYHYM